MANLSQLDLDVRLQLAGEGYTTILEKYINSLRYGKRNKNIQTQLILLDIYISILLNYIASDSDDDSSYNCVTEEQAQAICEKISILIDKCFQPIGYKYIGYQTYYPSSEETQPFALRVHTAFYESTPGNQMSPADTYSINIKASLTDTYIIDWGDGNTETHIGTGSTQRWYHTYTDGEAYHLVLIKGTFIGLNSIDIPTYDGRKVTELVKWGDNIWKEFTWAFYEWKYFNITATDTPTIALTSGDFEGAFGNCLSFNNSLSWLPSGITSIKRLLLNCSSFNQNIGSLNISSVTNASDFATNSGLSSANIDNILNGFAAQAPSIQNNVTIRLGSNLRTVASDASVTTLTSAPYNWTIINP